MEAYPPFTVSADYRFGFWSSRNQDVVEMSVLNFPGVVASV